MNFKMKRLVACSAFASGALVLGGMTQAQVVNKTLQNGLNGYAGTVDRKLSEVAANDVFGNTVAQYFLDGYSSGTTVSPDEQGLIRFDNLIGNGANQIPANAHIVGRQSTHKPNQKPVTACLRTVPSVFPSEFTKQTTSNAHSVSVMGSVTL